jgi:dTMP kinase
MKHINEQRHIIADRYAYSGVAYTSAKGYDLEWCKHPDRMLLKPDLVIFLDAPVSVTQSRGDFGKERYENESFQEKVKRQFELLKDSNWHVVDASQPVEKIQEIVRSRVLQLIQEHKQENHTTMHLWASPHLS